MVKHVLKMSNFNITKRFATNYLRIAFKTTQALNVAAFSWKSRFQFKMNIIIILSRTFLSINTSALQWKDKIVKKILIYKKKKEEQSRPNYQNLVSIFIIAKHFAKRASSSNNRESVSAWTRAD